MLEIFRYYPGVALVVTEKGSALLGAPTDAYKATKSYCNLHRLPFPKVLVAPQTMLIRANPQFNPEFFLYDFLFVFGAAYKEELKGQTLSLVVDADQAQTILEALRLTLIGPNQVELASYCDAQGHQLMEDSTIDFLTAVSDYMAIKKDGKKLSILEM
ncbi:MAG: hypothetical protein VYA34_14395, partial [Myxococcota bacterium]|nr:hypothetical protein [Myxococcota bacterium]